jgi:hypothetical protein
MEKCPNTADGKHVPFVLDAQILWKRAKITQCSKCGEILRIVEEN